MNYRTRSKFAAFLEKENVSGCVANDVQDSFIGGKWIYHSSNG